MASSLWDLQKALYKALASDSALNGLVTGVYDGAAPSAAVYPYVVLGETTEVQDDVLTRQGREVTVTIHAWSTYAGDKEVKLVLSRLDAMLHRGALVLDGWHVLLAMLDMVQVFHEGDSVRHGVLRMRYRVALK